MKWLFVTSEFPWPIIHGRWLRVYHLARTLVSLGDSVAILSCQESAEGIHAYGDVGVEVVGGIGREHVGKGPGRYLFSPFAYDAEFGGKLAASTHGYDVVVLCGSRVLQYADEVAASARVLFDMVDDPFLEFGRRRLIGNGEPFFDRLRLWRNQLGQKSLERKTLNRVKFTAFVSNEDCDSFNRRHPDHRTLFVPNGVDVDYFNPSPERLDEVLADPPKVVFTGHMSNPNNETAAKYLVQEIAPLIWKEIPQVHVQIVGSEPSPAVQALGSDRVTVTGRVDDMRPYLWNAGVVLLSMRSGTGIKNKLLEAWAARAPVVATPLACQGVPVVDGENLLLGTTPQELAQATCALLADREKRRVLAAKGRETVVRELTWDAAARRLRQGLSHKVENAS